MVHFDPSDLSDDLVRRRVDDVYIVASSVGLYDSDFPGSRGLRASQRIPTNPGGERLPFRVVLRLPVLASVVSRITARFLCKWVRQELAFRRITGDHSRAH